MMLLSFLAYVEIIELYFFVMRSIGQDIPHTWLESGTLVSSNGRTHPHIEAMIHFMAFILVLKIISSTIEWVLSIFMITKNLSEIWEAYTLPGFSLRYVEVQKLEKKKRVSFMKCFGSREEIFVGKMHEHE